MNKRKILITSGMSNYVILIITDAPKKIIEEWCRNYNKELENGKNTYFDNLKKDYYVRILHDSETEINNDDVDIIGYDEVYDLFDYSN